MIRKIKTLQNFLTIRCKVRGGIPYLPGKENAQMGYEYNNGKELSCLECGTEFYGRPDKKFCSPVCKNKYHNREASSVRHTRNYIITALQINYNILRDLLREGRRSASLQDLAIRGFNPGYVTGHSAGKCGHNEYSCFDIKYYQSSSKVFNLRRAI